MSSKETQTFIHHTHTPQTLSHWASRARPGGCCCSHFGHEITEAQRVSATYPRLLLMTHSSFKNISLIISKSSCNRCISALAHPLSTCHSRVWWVCPAAVTWGFISPRCCPQPWRTGTGGSILQLPGPSVNITLRVCSTQSPELPSKATPTLPTVVISSITSPCGSSPFPVSPPHPLPEIPSQTNYLHSNPCLSVGFWRNAT